MYSDHWILTSGTDVKMGVSITTNVNFISGTAAVFVITGNYVTIRSL